MAIKIKCQPSKRSYVLKPKASVAYCVGFTVSDFNFTKSLIELNKKTASTVSIYCPSNNGLNFENPYLYRCESNAKYNPIEETSIHEKMNRYVHRMHVNSSKSTYNYR